MAAAPPNQTLRLAKVAQPGPGRRHGHATAGPGPAEGTAPVELPDVDGEESQGDAVAKPTAPTEAVEPQP